MYKKLHVYGAVVAMQARNSKHQPQPRPSARLAD